MLRGCSGRPTSHYKMENGARTEQVPDGQAIKFSMLIVIFAGLIAPTRASPAARRRPRAREELAPPLRELRAARVKVIAARCPAKSSRHASKGASALASAPLGAGASASGLGGPRADPEPAVAPKASKSARPAGFGKPRGRGEGPGGGGGGRGAAPARLKGPARELLFLLSKVGLSLAARAAALERGLERRAPERLRGRSPGGRSAPRAALEEQSRHSADNKKIATAPPRVAPAAVSGAPSSVAWPAPRARRPPGAAAGRCRPAKAPACLRRSPPRAKERKVFGDIQQVNQLSSPEAAGKLESGGSASRRGRGPPR